MEAAAAVRKARIDALRRLRHAEEAGDSEAIAANEFGRAVKCAYRSSEPPAEVLAAAEASVTRDETIEQDMAGIEEAVLAEESAQETQELDLSMIAPKRPNWDLRRDYERQYAPLERQTRASIRTLIGAARGAGGEAEAAASLVADAEPADADDS